MPLPPILYEDSTMVAFDKPSGLLVAPDRWDKTRENLMGQVHAAMGRTVANIHRLDADTSGVLLCAKSKPALDFLSGQFQSKHVRKIYHALVVVLPVEQAMKVVAPIRTEEGSLPDAFTVDLALGADEANPGRMRVFRRRGGKACPRRGWRRATFAPWSDLPPRTVDAMHGWSADRSRVERINSVSIWPPPVRRFSATVFTGFPRCNCAFLTLSEGTRGARMSARCWIA